MIQYEQIAGEVLQTPCYIVEGEGQYLGRTHPRLDLYYEQILREQGRWAGRRPAIEINSGAIEKWTEGDENEGERITLCTLAHEIAHVADRDPPYYDPMPSDAYREFEQLCLAASSNRTAEESEAIRAKLNMPPWFGHGARHIRLALHIGYRVSRLVGIELPPSFVCAGSQYRLVSGSIYARALGDEPRNSAN